MREELGRLLSVAEGEVRLEGPPWILGERGAPLEAPENTLASFRRALDAGADGLCFDVHACEGGDPVVIADPRLERTTDGSGAVAEHGLRELFGLDAGGWFAKRFAGEAVPHLDEVLELETPSGGATVQLVRVHEPGLVEELARRAQVLGPERAPRFLARRRDLCTALLEQGLSVGLEIDEADEEDLAWARDRGVGLVATSLAAGWRNPTGERTWPCERWALGVDGSEELFETMRAGLSGLSTREPRRAIAVRTLLGLAGSRLERFPLQASALVVSNDPDPAGGGEWSGRWEPVVEVRNPFAHPVRVACGVFVQRGAFEVEGLPKTLELGPDEIARVSLGLRGGSWSPGGDPLFAALYDWDGATPGRLLLDVPLRRERRVVASAITRRVELLRESPGAARATMTLRRRGRELVVHVENPGGLVGARALVHLAGRTWSGARSLRATLPVGFDDLAGGLPFSCGFTGHEARGGREVLRRWAGGLPDDGRSGVPGRIFAR